MLAASCGPTPPPTPPTPPTLRPIAVNFTQPITLVHVWFDGAGITTPQDGTAATGRVGFPVFPATGADPSNVHIRADGYQPYDCVTHIPDGAYDFFVGETRYVSGYGQGWFVGANGSTCPRALTPTVPPLPPPPTRDEILNVRISFQGIDVVTQQFGTLPWFEAALPWLQPADRQAAYAAKHASKAWNGGDTHALIFLPSGPPLYDEPRQPYSADRFGPLDWTNGNTAIDPKLADLIAEAARAGFNRQLLFLGGDDGSTCDRNPVPPRCGFVIATKQAALVADALKNSRYGDLRPYVVVIPGFDGTFYGYTPDQIHQWGAQCRTLFLYCGFEHSTGHIPAGDGPGEWAAPNGPMRSYDLILSEFDDDRFDDSVWQIAARMIGAISKGGTYRRPADQPSDDDPNPPFYPKDPTDRGPIRDCAFEFGLYGQVHGAYGADHVNTAQRPYFKNIGYSCGG